MGSSIKLQFLWVCRSPAQNIYYRLLYIASYIIYSDYSCSCLMLFNHVLPSPNTQYPTMIVYNIFISLDGLHLLGLTLVKFLDFMRFLNVNPMLETLRLGIAQMSSKKKVFFYWPDSMDFFYMNSPTENWCYSENGTQESGEIVNTCIQQSLPQNWFTV